MGTHQSHDHTTSARVTKAELHELRRHLRAMKRAHMTKPHRRGHKHGHRGRSRARRGAVARSMLALLGEKPMHGYELINELEARTEGRWRPSPGAVYPALGRLEEKGLIRGEETDDGRRRYQITDAGQERLAAVDPDAPLPWEEAAEAGPGLHREMLELTGQLRQIGRFGSTRQREAAAAVLQDATRRLYAILAEPEPESVTEAEAAGPDDD